MSWFQPNTLTPVVPPQNPARLAVQELTSGSTEKKGSETSLSSASTSQSQAATSMLIGVNFSAKAKSSRRSKGRSGKDDGTPFSMETPFFPKLGSSMNQVYRFTQMMSIAVNTSSTTLAVFYAQAFLASYIDQISSLTAVFDQYRIDEIEVWIIPRIGVNNSSNTEDHGLFASVIDYDDYNSLTGFNQALDYTNVLVTNGKDGHYRRFKPHVAVAAYSGAFTSFLNEESPWIDAASTGVQHFGLKTAWTATDSVYNQSIQALYHMSWRNVR
jgi:hypothetical protein